MYSTTYRSLNFSLYAEIDTKIQQDGYTELSREHIFKRVKNKEVDN